MDRQSEKNLLDSNISPTSSQYGELRTTSGWDRFGCLGHPSKFQRVSRLGFVTARHSSSGRQPNFAALNRGRHLCLAGRPSRWALAHISSCILILGYWCQGAGMNAKIPLFSSPVRNQEKTRPVVGVSAFSFFQCLHTLVGQKEVNLPCKNSSVSWPKKVRLWNMCS